MRVTLNETIDVMRTLIAEERSRMEVAGWARDRRLAEDDGCLEYDPASDEKKIWDAISYLESVDLKDGPDSYLYSKSDFERFLNEELRQ